MNQLMKGFNSKAVVKIELCALYTDVYLDTLNQVTLSDD